MSIEAVVWAKNLPFDACPHGPFRVLLILAEHADSEGKRAFRSKRKIARTLEVSERSVQRWYKELVASALIRVGDQSYVTHIPANIRPIVYDLCMFRAEHFQQVELPDELSTGETTGVALPLSTGETTGVAVGETTGVVSRNQIQNLPNSIKSTNHSTRAGDNKDASGDSHRPASAVAGRCSNGHPIVDHSAAGIPFCALGCPAPAVAPVMAGARS